MNDSERKTIRIGDKSIPLPKSKFARIMVGVLTVFGGFLGFLPVLGFWMIPLGLFILSYDIPAVDRQRRRLTAWWRARRRRKGGGDRPELPSTLIAESDQPSSDDLKGPPHRQ